MAVLVLAAGGRERVGVDEPAGTPLDPRELLPAVGQGALALECREDDRDTRELLAAVNDADSAVTVAAERAFLIAIGGDCNTPLAAHARLDGGQVTLRAQVSDLEGGAWFREEGRRARDDAEA